MFEKIQIKFHYKNLHIVANELSIFMKFVEEKRHFKKMKCYNVLPFSQKSIKR